MCDVHRWRCPLFLWQHKWRRAWRYLSRQSVYTFAFCGKFNVIYPSTERIYVPCQKVQCKKKKKKVLMFELQWVSLCISVSQWWALLAGKSLRKPSVHFHSSFQQCEWCDSLLGQRDYWDQASPSSMPLAQPAKPAQSAPQAPRCLTEQPTRHTESKEAPGTPLIVNALGGSLASQHEEGPQSQSCPNAPRSALTQTFWGWYICSEALGFPRLSL